MSGDDRSRPLRIGDAERHAAVDALGEHFVAGRLDHDEHQQRCARALQARTAADLAALFADLPAPHPEVLSSPRASRPPVSAGSHAPPPARRNGGYPTVLVVGVAVVAILALTRVPFLALPLIALVVYLLLSRGSR